MFTSAAGPKNEPGDCLQEVSGRRIFPAAAPAKALDSLAQKRSQEALKGLTTFADNKGVGLKMLGQMGFGSSGLGLGKEGQVGTEHHPRGASDCALFTL